MIKTPRVLLVTQLGGGKLRGKWAHHAGPLSIEAERALPEWAGDASRPVSPSRQQACSCLVAPVARTQRAGRFLSRELELEKRLLFVHWQHLLCIDVSAQA